MQDVILASPAVLLKRPAKTTPWWDRMILAHTWRLTKVGGDVLILLWDIFPNCLKKDNDFFKVQNKLINKLINLINQLFNVINNLFNLINQTKQIMKFSIERYPPPPIPLPGKIINYFPIIFFK